MRLNDLTKKINMMKIKLTAMIVAFICLTTTNVTAQGLIDGFFNKKGEANLSLSYSYSTYDSFYVGKTKVEGVPAHNEITQDIFNFYANYGITDRLTAIVNLPYISSNGKGNPDPINGTTEQKDIQDLSVALKYNLHNETLKHGTMTYFAALGGSMPLGYEPTGILSIGNGAPTLDAKLGMHYKNNGGFFGTVALGYTVRGEADNNFNLGDGSDFDAPNSVNTLIKVGYSASIIYLDAWFDSQSTSKKGIDIGGPGFFGNFPETKVDYARVGGNVYVPIASNFGINAGVGTIVDGRNIGKGTTYTGGVVFKL